MTHTLDTVPPEILEKIAHFLATSSPIRPITGLASLIRTNRASHRTLSFAANAPLYAGIFHANFDAAPAGRRLGARVSAHGYADELRRRCAALARMRAGRDATWRVTDLEEAKGGAREVLWTAYMMMLEDEGRNVRLLREYAGVEAWLREYWLGAEGASMFAASLRQETWPVDRDLLALAMWLVWFLLDPDKKDKDLLSMLQIFALGAHKYPLCAPFWAEFNPAPRPALTPEDSVPYFGSRLGLSPPPLAAPAILSFLALVNRRPVHTSNTPIMALATPQSLFMAPIPPTAPSTRSRDNDMRSVEWDCEWARCLYLGGHIFSKHSPVAGDRQMTTFRPGSLEGIWEGMFMYSDFPAYGALLQGAPPDVLQRSTVSQHRQTWKLREYHYRGPREGAPLIPGVPLRGFFSPGTRVEEAGARGAIEFRRDDGVCRYVRAGQAQHNNDEEKDEGWGGAVEDVIVAGEGHSAWGQFNLLGRVRPADGFVYLSKIYTDGDRGEWLYRGYLVGDAHGNVVGRWRDTLTPVAEQGYEGCFAMSRRR